MKISVKGKNESLSKRETRDAIRFFGEKLLRKDLRETIKILVEYEIIKTHKASCIYLDNNIRPRDFYINVDNRLSKWNQIKSIAHEMVHVKQYARGELQDYVTPKKANKVKWKRKTHSTIETDENYWMSPWEIEAYGTEVGLCELYKKHLKLKKNK